MSSVAPAEMAGPLAGVRILDLTSVIMGPYATQILADLGADVITVEPRGGDTSRSMDRGAHPELSGVALNLLRNKRNVSIDYKTPVGRDAVLRIAATADVVIANHRPGVARRAGLEYADFVRAREDIIYCQALGYATGSGREDQPAYDDVIQAASGVVDANRLAGGEPRPPATLLADKVSGLSIVYAVTAALFARERHGRGTSIEVPMVDVMTAFMLVEHGGAAITQSVAGRPGYDRILTQERRPQATVDGLVSILPYSRKNYDAILAWGGRGDLIDDERYATKLSRIHNSAFLYRTVREIVVKKSTEECLEFCRVNENPAVGLASIADLVAKLPLVVHPVVGAFHAIPNPIRIGPRTGASPRPAPLIGQHTVEVLEDVGYSHTEVEHLLSSGTATQAYEATPNASQPAIGAATQH